MDTSTGTQSPRVTPPANPPGDTSRTLRVSHEVLAEAGKLAVNGATVRDVVEAAVHRYCHPDETAARSMKDLFIALRVLEMTQHQTALILTEILRYAAEINRAPHLYAAEAARQIMAVAAAKGAK